MDQCTTLHEDTGGNTQQDKIMFCCWKWHYCNGEKITKQVEEELAMHGEQTRSIRMKTSTRTLRMYLTPDLEWKGQFEAMRKKIHMSITKLVNAHTNPYQTTIYFNVHVITSVFFGCGIV